MSKRMRVFKIIGILAFWKLDHNNVENCVRRGNLVLILSIPFSKLETNDESKVYTCPCLNTASIYQKRNPLPWKN